MRCDLVTTLSSALRITATSVPDTREQVHAADQEDGHKEYQHQQDLGRSDLSHHSHSLGRLGVVS
ncbi:hypothetical protein ASF05_12270 [Aeromicrobium sp. Leaf245]|nr:hypothetical protein ASF05_12270 [Aeromicrobium sp. Leaf245]